MNDPVTDKALRLLEKELEEIGFDLDESSQTIIRAVDRRARLLERRSNVAKLYRMHGGSPAPFEPDRAA